MNQMRIPGKSKLWLMAAAGLLCVQIVASLGLPRSFALTTLSDLSQLVLLVSGTLALLPNVRLSRGRTRLFWVLMTLGVAFWLAYHTMWSYFEVFRRAEVPNPFVGDIVLFLHLVPMMAALAIQPHVEQDNRTVRLGSLDFALLLIWWIYLYLFTVIPWQYVYGKESAYDRNLNALYLTEKIVLLAGLVLLWLRSQNAWKKIYAHWFVACAVYALASYLANRAIEKKVYFTGCRYDILVAASMASVTVVGVLAYHSAASQEPARHSRTYGVWVARLGMISIFSLPLFAAWSLFDSATPPPVRTFRLVVTLGTILFMGALVFLKQHLLDRELLRLLEAAQESFENLRRVQAQLVQSEKLASLGQLVGGAAHELNNPLTAMLGYSELLSATCLSDEQRSLMQKIEYQVRRTRTLVSSLLSFARQVPGEKNLLDINALVQTAVKLCPPQLRRMNIQVHTDLTPDLPRVFGDSNQLLQVCLHVTSNAYHAMAEKGGVLKVNSKVRDGWIILEFADEGGGIQQPERVFDPFYTTRPVGQGAGLGLSVCYGIVQEHRGELTCHNRPEGGALFRIQLPAAEDALEPNRSCPQLPAPGTRTAAGAASR